MADTPSSTQMPTFTDIFIKRPVLASVVSLLILLVGLQSLFSLPIRQFPFLENVTINITTQYPGASPEVVRSFITQPIEQAVASAEGIDTIASTSTIGTSSISIRLQLDADSDRAFTDVSAKVDSVRFLLPQEAFDPVVSREPGNDQALMYIDFPSDELNASQVTDYLLRVVQPALQSVKGVGAVRILGAQTFAMRVWIKPEKLAAVGVTAGDVRRALEDNNFTSAPGQIKGHYVKALIEAKTNLNSVKEFEELVISATDSRTVRLRDVADVELGPEDASTTSYAGANRTVFMSIDAAPSANPLSVIPAVRNRLDELRNKFPIGLDANIAFDATTYISQAIAEVVKTVGEAAVIVVIVLFLFLGRLRATLVPVITIPLSLIGVMFAMQLMGYSINLLTLLALVLAIGLVVDDAIVVVENITRHIEEGKPRLEASLLGARQIALPVIGMTITLAAVYAPIGFATGLTGILFREFAFTLAAAVIISGIVALTLSPMMCSRILQDGEPSRFAKVVDRYLGDLERWYEKALVGTMRARGTVFTIGLVLLGSCYMLFTESAKELSPNEDQGFVFLLNRAPEWTNIDYMNKYVSTFHESFQKFPEYETSFLINTNGGGQGFGGMILKDWAARDRGPNDILPQLSGELSKQAGITTLALNPPALPGSTGGPPVQFVIQTLGSYEELNELSGEIKQRADKSGLFIFTDLSLSFDQPQINMEIDRGKANLAGVTMEEIGNTLSVLLGDGYINFFDLDGRSYRVIPQVARKDRLVPDMLKTYYVRTRAGGLTPLANFITLKESVEPNSLTTFQQLKSATIQGVPFPGTSLGQALDFLAMTADEVLPREFSYDYDGESRQLKQEGDTLTIIFGFAMIVIFLVLAAQYESFRDPLIILVSVPMSLAGALLVINMGGQVPGLSINIYTQIGLLTLAGLISKHGILMVSFANEIQDRDGLNRREAIVKAATLRLRPILMTTVSMVAGVMPLLIAEGAGAVSRFAIGMTIAAGMTLGTLFTLFIVPAVYSVLAHKSSGKTAAPSGNAVPSPAE
ncbi:MAG: efflux RND transporter permease subunit [Pseudomonadota bacterium]